jgi:hypothetical protein
VPQRQALPEPIPEPINELIASTSEPEIEIVPIDDLDPVSSLHPVPIPEPYEEALAVTFEL